MLIRKKEMKSFRQGNHRMHCGKYSAFKIMIKKLNSKNGRNDKQMKAAVWPQKVFRQNIANVNSKKFEKPCGYSKNKKQFIRLDL